VTGVYSDRGSRSVAGKAKVGDDGDEGRGLHFRGWSGERRIGWAEGRLGEVGKRVKEYWGAWAKSIWVKRDGEIIASLYTCSHRYDGDQTKKGPRRIIFISLSHIHLTLKLLR
jgi:hypothetical protein